VTYTVYLDSSDYSWMASPPAQDVERAAQALEDLTTLVESGVIICPISLFHILEMLHLDPAFRPAALGRARIAKRLAAGKYLVWITDAIADEAAFQLGASRNSSSVVGSEG
jgi:hypothetical protein